MTSPSMRGFTLIELAIAITILAIIMTYAYSALSSMARSKTALDDGRDADMIANALLTRLTRELGGIQAPTGSTPFLYPRCDPQNPNPTPPNKFLEGTREALTSGARGDRISFIASDVGQYLPDGGTHLGQVQILYLVEERPDAAPGEALHTLVREEIPYRLLSGGSFSSAAQKRVCDKMIRFPVTDRLRSLSFEYYDARNQRWVDSWPASGGDPVPDLIRFSVTLESERGTLRTYATSVPLRRS